MDIPRTSKRLSEERRIDQFDFLRIMLSCDVPLLLFISVFNDIEYILFCAWNCDSTSCWCIEGTRVLRVRDWIIRVGVLELFDRCLCWDGNWLFDEYATVALYPNGNQVQIPLVHFLDSRWRLDILRFCIDPRSDSLSCEKFCFKNCKKCFVILLITTLNLNEKITTEWMNSGKSISQKGS